MSFVANCMPTRQSLVSRSGWYEAAVVLLASVPWFLSHVVAFAAVDFFGLGMQQYAFYTSRVFSECWVEEGAPVVALVALALSIVTTTRMLLLLCGPSQAKE